ncbi:F1F0 ATP synthase subunit e NDAI_0C04370 [Naumovozyma dairenensis CBS 421]|uniref:ATP synthase F(0) complex subunit e, mitochondrial n=1 Tax=Naumovozyma dairenensis (strain ATCC 10597 / BCRC 20456 / CBS 421 / NBRC 0211 / NRRL Y-12639) TaxID=1071378 RepID=G0W8I6_NAUDC|nr:hypothetical protein NDAI_0C04370 [Naumovozyma dairenensis CBS 421]CCD24097.1 hypothetical protein NDAI_0C04370 [Naumovozyma dairenensis CBS 421]
MSTLNVLRYSALGLGLWCGFRNDLSLKNVAAEREQQKKYDEEVKLINEAKQEYAKLRPIEKKPETVSLENVQLDDPKLDFAELILNAVDSMKDTTS